MKFNRPSIKRGLYMGFTMFDDGYLLVASFSLESRAVSELCSPFLRVAGCLVINPTRSFWT